MNKETLNKEFDNLYEQGQLLYYSMYLLDKEGEEVLKKQNIKTEDLPSFKSEYQSWYTQALFLIKLVAPHRLNDFEELYKKKKGKELNVDTYCLSDALLDISFTRGVTVIAKPTSALGKMKQQVLILRSIKDLVQNHFYNLELEIHNDVMDSELDSA